MAALNPREVRDIERRIGPQGLARPSAPAIVSGKLRGSMEQIRAAAASDPTSRRLINAAGAWAANLFLGPADRVFNIYGPPDSLQTFDYLKILQTDKDGSLAAQIRDKVIFVGAAEHHTNSGIDRYFTPYPAPPGKKYGGVELVAMAFANVRDGTTLRQLNVGQGAMLLGLIDLVVMAAGWRWEPQRALPAIALRSTSRLSRCMCGYRSSPHCCSRSRCSPSARACCNTSIRARHGAKSSPSRRNTGPSRHQNS